MFCKKLWIETREIYICEVRIMGVFVCDKCEAIANGETTVGLLIKEGDILQREGLRVNEVKLMQALDKYNEAWKILQNNNGHADCIKYIDDEYESLYRIMQGSRA